VNREERWTKDVDGVATAVVVEVDDLGVVRVSYDVLAGMLRELGWVKRWG
jgi:hypothetical protein